MTAKIMSIESFKRAREAKSAERQRHFVRCLEEAKPMARPISGSQFAPPALLIKDVRLPPAERLRLEQAASEGELMLALSEGEWGPATQIAAEILAQSLALSRWEFGFLQSMHGWAGAPTPKQGRVLVKLAHDNDVPVTLWRNGPEIDPRGRRRGNS